MKARSHAYPISPQRQRLIYIVCGLLGGIPLVLLGFGLVALSSPESGGEAAGLVVVACIVLVIAAPFVLYMWFWARRLSLTLSEQGVEVFNGRQRPLIPWSNVVQFNTQPQCAGLVLQNAPPGLLTPLERQAGGVRIGAVPLIPDDISGAVAQGRFVDLRAFAGHFKHGDLLSRIYAFAPHLVEPPSFSEVEDGDSEKRRAERKKGILFLLGVVLVIVGSFMAGMFIDGEVSTTTEELIDKFVYGSLSLLFGLMGVVTVTSVARMRWSQGLYGWFILWTLVGGAQALVGFYVFTSQFS